MIKQKSGKVVELFISKNDTKIRINQDQISLDINGVIDDKFYGKNIQRSVLLISQDSYNLVKEKNINLAYGQLGENILIDYNPYHLQIGTKIQIGEVILEISQESTLCKNLSNINHYLSKLLKDDRGIFAKVLVDGIVNKRDEFYILLD